MPCKFRGMNRWVFDLCTSPEAFGHSISWLLCTHFCCFAAFLGAALLLLISRGLFVPLAWIEWGYELGRSMPLCIVLVLTAGQHDEAKSWRYLACKDLPQLCWRMKLGGSTGTLASFVPFFHRCKGKTNVAKVVLGLYHRLFLPLASCQLAQTSNTLPQCRKAYKEQQEQRVFAHIQSRPSLFCVGSHALGFKQNTVLQTLLRSNAFFIWINK